MTDIAEAVARRRWANKQSRDSSLANFDKLPAYFRQEHIAEAKGYSRAFYAEFDARGVKVVPMVPTEAMMRACVSYPPDNDEDWRNMIAAAPPAPGSET